MRDTETPPFFISCLRREKNREGPTNHLKKPPGGCSTPLKFLTAALGYEKYLLHNLPPNNLKFSEKFPSYLIAVSAQHVTTSLNEHNIKRRQRNLYEFSFYIVRIFILCKFAYNNIFFKN